MGLRVKMAKINNGRIEISLEDLKRVGGWIRRNPNTLLMTIAAGALGAIIGRKLDIKEALKQKKEKPEIKLKAEP